MRQISISAGALSQTPLGELTGDKGEGGLEPPPLQISGYATDLHRLLRQTVVLRAFLGRPEPPFRTGLFYRRCFLFFIFSPRFLRDTSTDRPETLPRGRNLAEFYKLTSKILGVLP